MRLRPTRSFPHSIGLNAREASHCPNCDTLQDQASCTNQPGAQPKEGDGSVCYDCLAFLKFGPGLRLELLTEEDKAGAFAGVLQDLEEARQQILRIRDLA